MFASVYVCLLTGPVGAGDRIGLSNLFALDLRPTATTVRGAVEAELPNRCSLGQAYPNPFNSSTTIRFAVDGNERLPIEISIHAGDGCAACFVG